MGSIRARRASSPIWTRPRSCARTPNPSSRSTSASSTLEQALKRREQQALEKIAQAEAEALSEVRGQAVDLAVAASARLLADNLDEEKAARLVDEAIKDLSGRLH